MDFIKGVSLTFITYIITFVLGTAAGIIFVRSLGPEIVGINGTIAVITSTLIQFGSLGMHTSTVYYSSNKEIPIKTLAGNILLIGSIIGAILATAAAIITYFKPELLLNEISPIYLYAALFVIPLSLTSDFIRNAFLGQQNIRFYNFIDIAASIINLLALIALLLIFKKGLLEILIFTNILAATTTIYSIWHFKRLYGISFKPSLKIIKKLITHGWVFFVCSVLGFLMLKSDIYILNQMIDLEQVGFYKIASQYSDTIITFSAIISTVLLPKLCSEKDKTTDRSLKATRSTTAIMLFIGLCFLIFGKIVIQIMYGQIFLPAYTPLLIIIPGTIFYALETVQVMYLISTGFPKIVATGWFTATATNILLNLLFIKKWGIIGAAISSTISYFMIFFLVALLYKKRIKKPLSEIYLIKKSDIQKILQTLSALIPKKWQKNS